MSSSRRLTSAIAAPTTSPIAIPPTTATTKSTVASNSENLPPIAAATATRYAISAEESLSRLSPSTRFTRRRGAPSWRAIAVAATGSVGETMAPSANATAQGRPMSSWPTTATAQVVASTNPIEVSDKRAGVGAQRPQIREEGRHVEQRRQEDHQHQVGVELDVRDAGQVAERDRPEHEHDRVRDAEQPSDDAQRRDRDAQAEDQELGVVHGQPLGSGSVRGVHGASVPASVG